MTHPVPEEARDVIAQALHDWMFRPSYNPVRAADAVLAALAEAGYRVVRQEQVGVGHPDKGAIREAYSGWDFDDYLGLNPFVPWVPVWVDSEPSETPT